LFLICRNKFPELFRVNVKSESVATQAISTCKICISNSWQEKFKMIVWFCTWLCC
jgi:hypothetical protein